MIVSGFEGTCLNSRTEKLISEQGIGGLILFERNYENPKQLKKLISDLQSLVPENSPPLFISVDQEGGRVARLKEPFTQFPPMCCLGNANSEDLAYRFGLAMGKEMKAVGINMDYAPVLDVHSNPENPIIGKRAISSDPDIVARLGCKIIQGFKDAGTFAVGKHFPGHGDTSQDSHLTLPRVERTQESLGQIELIPFAKAFQEGLDVIMTAHVVYPAWDEISAATFSKFILNDLLRKKMGFTGLVMSDDLEMQAVTQAPEEIPALAINAGVDLFLICHDLSKVTHLQNALIDGFETEKISHEAVENSFNRIIKAKQKLNDQNDVNLEQVLSENQKLAEEMRSYLIE
ncbi:MAG: beta-N-acetylhexosaminidase [Nitrospina sp.]|jgi:beta-N-acetylhexosaminidase|nr:beta-N-acetylhexosaminidase [Nitrospina sp.]MBT6716570.1 beta-N-acetylhexosaminidase [Nitrospina sp.]